MLAKLVRPADQADDAAAFGADFGHARRNRKAAQEDGGKSDAQCD
jgi:hypothetical protein